MVPPAAPRVTGASSQTVPRLHPLQGSTDPLHIPVRLVYELREGELHQRRQEGRDGLAPVPDDRRVQRERRCTARRHRDGGRGLPATPRRRPTTASSSATIPRAMTTASPSPGRVSGSRPTRMTASVTRSRTGPMRSPRWTEPERNLPPPAFCTQTPFQTLRSRQAHFPGTTRTPPAPPRSGRISNYSECRRRARRAPSAPAMIALPLEVIHYAPVHRLPRRRVFCGPDRSPATTSLDPKRWRVPAGRQGRQKEIDNPSMGGSQILVGEYPSLLVDARRHTRPIWRVRARQDTRPATKPSVCNRGCKHFCT